MKKIILLLSLLTLPGALAQPQALPGNLPLRPAGLGAQFVSAHSYKGNPFLRDAGVFRTQAHQFNVLWAAARQRGQCDVTSTESLTLEAAARPDLPRLESRLLAALRGQARVRPVGRRASAALFRVDVSGRKAVAMTLTRLQLPNGTPALRVQTCQMG